MEITERQFVAMLRRRAAAQVRGARAGSGLRQGIGDDCAVVAGSGRNDWLITTDLFLEGTHFRRKWQAPGSAGHKALARGLSDIAAMGGTPRYAFLSLGLPPRIELRWVSEFLRGFLRLAAAQNVVLAGGDTGAFRKGVVADVIVMGEVPRNQSVLRSGARPGDEIWVTGRLGAAACGLAAVKGGKRSLRQKEYLRAFFYPQPRLEVGRHLRERKLVSAMIDLSDGLSLDLARLCEQSGVGARIVEDWLPRRPETPLRYVLHGGEDLELLFTVPSARARLLPPSFGGVRLTRVGDVIPSQPGRSGRNLWLIRRGKPRPLPVLGFQHF